MVRVAASILTSTAVLAWSTSPVSAADAPQPSTSAPVEFRGAQLGMTLEEWKAAPPPPELFHPGKAVCSAEQPNAPWVFPRLSAAQKAAGAVLCIYVVADGHALPVGQRMGPSEITDVSYLFLQNKLYQIDLMAVDKALDAITDGLRAKYGPPSKTSIGTVQNRAGETLPSIYMDWELGAQGVHLSSPAGRLNRMTVTYVHHPTADRVDAAAAADLSGTL